MHLNSIRNHVSGWEISGTLLFVSMSLQTMDFILISAIFIYVFACHPNAMGTFNGIRNVIFCINRFTSLCKNLFNQLEFLAEAFQCHVLDGPDGTGTVKH